MNPFCPKCGGLMRVKKISGTRYWVCSKGHRYKTGAEELGHHGFEAETTVEVLSEAMQRLLARITLNRRLLNAGSL